MIIIENIPFFLIDRYLIIKESHSQNFYKIKFFKNKQLNQANILFGNKLNFKNSLKILLKTKFILNSYKPQVSGSKTSSESRKFSIHSFLQLLIPAGSNLALKISSLVMQHKSQRSTLHRCLSNFSPIVTSQY
jgi:hypothetical protein